MQLFSSRGCSWSSAWSRGRTLLVSASGLSSNSPIQLSGSKRGTVSVRTESPVGVRLKPWSQRSGSQRPSPSSSHLALRHCRRQRRPHDEFYSTRGAWNSDRRSSGSPRARLIWRTSDQSRWKRTNPDAHGLQPQREPHRSSKRLEQSCTILVPSLLFLSVEPSTHSSQSQTIASLFCFYGCRQLSVCDSLFHSELPGSSKAF